MNDTLLSLVEEAGRWASRSTSEENETESDHKDDGEDRVWTPTSTHITFGIGHAGKTSIAGIIHSGRNEAILGAAGSQLALLPILFF